MGASNRGGDEGDSGSPGATRQNQQADGRLPAQRIQDAGGVLRFMRGESSAFPSCASGGGRDFISVKEVRKCNSWVAKDLFCAFRQFSSRTSSRKTTVSHVRSWTQMLTRTTLVC